MSRPIPRLRRGAAVLAVVIACSAVPLRAQDAYAEPADGATAAAKATPVAPFAVVHPAYVPSQPAPDEQVALNGSDEIRPPKAAHAHKRNIALADTRAASQDDSPATVEPPTAAERLLALSVPTPPVVADRPPPAATPAGVTLTQDDVLRLLALAAGGAIAFAAVGFALGRRSGRKAYFRGAIAKTQTWQAVMPADLAGTSLEDDDSFAGSPGKRMKRGGPVEPDGAPVVSRL